MEQPRDGLGHFKEWKNKQDKGPAVATETESGKLGNKDAKISELQSKLKAIEDTSRGDMILNKRSTAKDNAKVLTATFPEQKLIDMVKAILVDLDVPPEIEKALREEARAIARQKRST